MALKKRVSDLSKVPEKFHGLYVEDGDEFVLDNDLAIDDDDDSGSSKDKIKEFRTNNIKLQKQNDELAEKVKTLEEKFASLGDTPPDMLKQAIEMVNKIEEEEDRKLIAAGRIDEVVQKRSASKLDAVKKDLTARITALEADLTKAHESENLLKSRLSQTLITTNSQAALGKIAAIRTGAMDDVAQRANRVWKMGEDGEFVAHDQNGEPIYNNKGEPISWDDWAASLVKDAPHLFEGGSGGGAGGSSVVKKGGQKYVPQGDPVEFGKNLEAIAKGEVKVGNPNG